MSIWVLVGGIVVALIIFTILIKIIQTTVKTAFTIAAIVLILQFVFQVNVFDLLKAVLSVFFR